MVNRGREKRRRVQTLDTDTIELNKEQIREDDDNGS